MSHFRIVVRFHWQPRLMKYWKKDQSTLHSPSWTEISSSYLYAFIIYPSISTNSSSALHYKDGKNIFSTRHLTLIIFQKYRDNHTFLNHIRCYKNMTASKFHPIDATKNRVLKSSDPIRTWHKHLHIDTFNIFYARIIVEHKKTFYFCKKIMDRDSDECLSIPNQVL